jgi:glutaredoxin|tara:strand:+ start:4856 stop:5350 length:495 start_codon:yes stop_codon:yes gene_type:complete
MKKLKQAWRLCSVLLAIGIILFGVMTVMKEQKQSFQKNNKAEAEIINEVDLRDIEKPIMVTTVEEESQIIMYSAPWCKWCTVAKKFFKENKINYSLKRMNNPEEYAELLEIAKNIGYKGALNATPLFIIKDKIIIGFNKKEIMCLLELSKCDTIEFTRSKTELD